jgi:hypothetical protein
VNHATAESSVSPLDTVGVICARAAFVAVLLGVVEGIVVSRLSEISVSGIGIATAGLWFPIALLFLLPASLLRRVRSPRVVATALVIALMIAVIFAKATPNLAAPLRAAPIEGIAALGLAYAASRLELDAPFKRPIAIAGIVLAVALQVYGTYWVDSHRAFAGLLVEHTAVPRVMLKAILRRFV